MDKHTIKRIVELSNEWSLACLDKNGLIKKVIQRLDKVSYQQIEWTLDALTEIGAIEWIHGQMDCMPCLVIYAKSVHYSTIEALALYEMILFKHRNCVSDHHIDTNSLPSLLQGIVKNSILLENDCINKNLYPLTQKIYQEPQDNILSDTLNILFTNQIVEHTIKTSYKNENRSMIEFKDKEFLLQVIPKMGIPENREVSKNLQIFYKDTQMHEFDKTCPICGVHIPHMLIASHIKPFRDCAHIYEAATHDNGLLLCRNHDYLFDQGYISFDDEGNLLISHELSEENQNVLSLHSIDSKFMTYHRKLFMAYHRKHIFKG